MRWGVVVAAGGEAPPPLQRAARVVTKGEALVGGRASLALVLEAVRAAEIGECVVVGSARLDPHMVYGKRIDEGESAVDNARRGVAALGSVEGVLFLPADAPLLTAEMLRAFVTAVERRQESAGWLAVGLSPAQAFAQSYPEVPFQAIRLREGRHLSGALYAASPEGLARAFHLLTQLRRRRKSQLAMLRKIGFGTMLTYFSGQMTFARAEQVLGRVFGAQAIAVPECHPATCLDFDTGDEWATIDAIATRAAYR